MTKSVKSVIKDNLFLVNLLVIPRPGYCCGPAMEVLVTKTEALPWRGVLALLGGFLIQLSLGSFYSFGNMMTYLTSYMR